LSSYCTAATSVTSTTFRVAETVNGGFEANRTVPAATGSGYGSRVFSIRASTTAITLGGGTSTRTITVQVTGTKGYLSSDVSFNVSSTRFWNSGGVNYKFLPLEYTTYTTDQDVSDSYPVSARFRTPT
jgi:hypothetical protein